MTIIFQVKTKEAYAIKIMAELLANNIKTGCFEIDSEGVHLRMMDHHRKILINLKLDGKSSGFSIYKFTTKKMFLGINLNHFYKMVRSVKKKDHIELYIDDENPTDLCIKVTPKENNRTTTSIVKIQSIQNLDIDLPNEYDRPISVPSSDYQKLIKEMNTIGNVVKISAKKFSIKFACDAGGVLKKMVDFGENDPDDQETIFSQDFNTEQLCRITKFAGLSDNIQIFPGFPLLFKTNIGTIGNMDIYIKSKDQLEKESYELDESEDDDDSDS